MKRRAAASASPSLVVLFVLSFLSLAAVACGGDDDDGGDSTCGPGTVLSDGECVPDGTVICETGTTFNEETGSCEPDITGCGEGTVLVDGECLPEGSDIEVDFEEEPEPNDGFEASDGFAGAFELPGAGDDGVVVHGCVTPYRDLDANGNPDTDFDMWLVSTGSPALVEITADGVGGLAAGFILLPGDQANLVGAAWQRFGLNLSGDTSRRQIYLPVAGVYALAMTDSRSLFLTDGAAGSEETCYYTTVARVEMPAPIPANLEENITGTVGNDTLFYSFDASQGGLYNVLHNIASQAALPSAVGVLNGDFISYGEGFSFFGIPFPAEIFLGGQRASDEVIVVVEPTYNYALEPVAFELSAHALPVSPLPDAGGTEPINGTGPSFETLDDLRWAWFDVGADQVVHFDLAFSANANLVFVGPDLSTISVPSFPPGGGDPGDPAIDTFNGWLRFPGPGRYYAALMSPAGNNFDVSGRLTRVTPTEIDIGTPITDASFNDLGAAWYSLDTTNQDWLGFNAGATGFGGDVLVDLFPPTGIGEPDIDFDSDDQFSFNPNGSQTFGRIVFDTNAQYLVRVSDDSGAANGGDSYDLSVAERDFTDLGATDDSSPIDRPDEPLDGNAELYFVRGAPGDQLTITVTPDAFNASLQILGAAENVIETANAGGAGAAETLQVAVGDDTWVAFRVNRVAGAGTSFGIAITAQSPGSYDDSTGSLNYVDVCGPGTNITPADDDEGLTTRATLPFSFPLFGFASGDRYVVSTNGWIAFGEAANAAFVNPSLPDVALPNGVVAPYWDDIVVSSICRLNGGNRTTIQWEGSLYADSSVQVQFQVVLRSNGRIDFIYGPDHQADGASGTVGLETLDGALGEELVQDSAGDVLPGTSFTLTPQ
jgi:hypothetical protein